MRRIRVAIAFAMVRVAVVNCRAGDQIDRRRQDDQQGGPGFGIRVGQVFGQELHNLVENVFSRGYLGIG